MTEARTNVTQDAAVRLMMKYPFWSELYYTMTVYQGIAPDVSTAATDGRNLWVNEDFWRELTLELKVATMAHEICHKMLLHSTRRGARDPFLWNVAADYVVNYMLKSNGFQLGQGWLFDAKYNGWSTEAVYSDIEAQAQQQKQDRSSGQQQGQGGSGEQEDESEQDGQGGEGGSDDADSDDSGADGQSPSNAPASGQSKPNPQKNDSGKSGQGNSVTLPGVSQEWKDKWQDIREVTGAKEAVEKFEKQVIEQVQKAMMTARAHGNGPGGMEAFDDVCEPSKEPWYNHLHRYMQSLSVTEYNWAKMNRRTLVQHHIFAPHHYAESLGEIVFGIDCSGSVFGAAEQANFAGHVNAILAEAKPSKVHVMYFDSDVTRHDELEYGALEFHTRPAGGGGTDFRPVFEAIEEKGIVPELVVMLTDCYGGYPKEKPPYPVIWASIEENPQGYFPPFGEFIHVE